MMNSAICLFDLSIELLTSCFDGLISVAPFCCRWRHVTRFHGRQFNTFMDRFHERYGQILLFCYEVQYLSLDYRIQQRVTKFVIVTPLTIRSTDC